MPIVPPNFNGDVFIAKFNVSENDFWVANGELICPSLPDLTDADIADCVTDLDRYSRINDRTANAKPNAKAVPGWATWDEAQANDWYNANISDTQIDAISNLAEAKVVMKDMSLALRNLGIIVIAMRDKIWPDLPE